MTCNIPSYIDDPSYRYKMPRIQTRIEGRGNGIKTNMVNMIDVGRALKCNPAYPTKFLGCELGALSSYSENEEKAIVNGAHETNIAQQLIDKFIEKFILCPKCKLPETDMKVKAGILIAGCKACGWAGDLDNAHKLVKFVVTTEEKGPVGGGKKLDKKARREAKQAKQRGNADDSDSEEQVKKEKKEKKEKKKDKKKKSKGDDADSDSGAEEKKKKKKKKHKKDKKDKKEKKDKKKKEKDDSSDDESEAGPGDLKFDDELIKESYLRLQKLNTAGKPLKASSFYDELRMIQVQNAFSLKLRVYVALEALFGEEMTGAAVEKHAGHIEKLVTTPKMPIEDILYGFEVYYLQHPGALKQYPMALKALHDKDVVTEEDLLKHYAKSLDTEGFAEAKEAAQPFLKWLAASSESGSDSGSDSDSDSD